MKKQYNTIIEQFFTFSLITPVIMMTLFVLSLIINSAVEDKVIIDFFVYTFFIISGLIFSFTFYILIHEKTSKRFYINYIEAIILFDFAICFLFKKQKTFYVIFPVSIIQFFLQMIVNDVFVMRGVFVQHWDGKTGKELQTRLYHQSMEAADNAHSIRKFQLLLSVISVGYFAACYILKKAKVEFNALLIINSLIFVENVFYGFYLVGYYNRESIYANMGYDVLIPNWRNFQKVIISIFLLSVILAGGISRNNSFLHINFTESQGFDVQAQIPHSDSVEYKEVSVKKENLEESMGNSKNIPVLELSVRIIEIVCIIILCVIIFIFLINPFRSSGFIDFWKENKLKEYIKNLIHEIKTFFRSFFGKKVDSYSTLEAKSFKNSIQNLLKNTKKSKAKRIELDRLTKQFMELILWGSKREIIYKNTLAPAEYTTLVAQYLQKVQTVNSQTSDTTEVHISECANVAGNLFEKALYDKELLSKEEEMQFTKAIKNITKI